MFLTLANARARISENSQHLTGCCSQICNGEGSKKPEKVKLELHAHFFFSVLHIWQTVNTWVTCWGKPLLPWNYSHFCLPLYTCLVPNLRFGALLQPSSIAFSSGASEDLLFWMKYITPQWRWRWHLGRRVWWCPARKGGPCGSSSSRQRSDTESSWSRWALFRCSFIRSCRGWSVEKTYPTQHVYFDVWIWFWGDLTFQHVPVQHWCNGLWCFLLKKKAIRKYIPNVNGRWGGARWKVL